VRIGVSEGKGILYRDINGNYNIAGNPINFACRLLGLGDRSQILATEDSYKTIIDMTEDTTLEGKFTLRGPVEIKHKLTINVYQYVGEESYVNTDTPSMISFRSRMDELKESALESIGVTTPKEPAEMMRQAERMIEILKILGMSGDNTGFVKMISSLLGGDDNYVIKLQELISAQTKLKEIRSNLFDDK
jgi:hypothetical protein